MGSSDPDLLTLRDEHFRFEGRKTWYESVEQMQKDLDTYLHHDNRERSHQGRNINGRVPYQAFIVGLPKSEPMTRTVTREAAKPITPPGAEVSGDNYLCTHTYPN